MLPSVKAVSDLTLACKTLLFWQAEKDKKVAVATGQVIKWVELVTDLTATAKVAVARLNVDNFIQHSIELVEYKVDTSYIQSIQLVASKPTFTAYNKLKDQLAMYQACNDYALKQASLIAEMIIENRNVIKQSVIVETAIRLDSTNEFRENKKELKFSKLNVGYQKVTKEPIVSGLLKVARKVQPAIDLENEHRFKGIIARQARQAYRNKQKQADKLLRQALELAQTKP
jgi:hypothetical protein